MQAKLNPKTPASPSSTSAVGKLNFPGFQETLDFTSAGSESSVSVAVSGDTDKECKMLIRNTISGGSNMYLCVNGDTTDTHYGGQYITNGSGSISAARRLGQIGGWWPFDVDCGVSEHTLLTPTGFIKTGYSIKTRYTSGTTVAICQREGFVWNSTANVTSFAFNLGGGNFSTGTRVSNYDRRSNV